MSTNKRIAWIDANVVLRYLLRDNEDLFKSVCEIFLEAENGDLTLMIHILTLAEIIWTLESYYECSKEEISTILEELIDADGIEMHESEIVKNALTSYRDNNVDFVDAYLAEIAFSKGPATIYTLDRKHFSRLTGDIKLL